MSELEEKIGKLPAWAQRHIKFLETCNEPAAEEIATLRKKMKQANAHIRRQSDRINAMVELFQCAAKGGSELAAAVKEIVSTWTVNEDNEEPADHAG